MIKILHTGDVHLDSAFSGLDSRHAEIRRNELRAAFTSMMTYARANGIDLLLIAGDLFDGAYVTRETVALLVREFERFGKPVFIAPGNHDPASADSVWTRITFPGNVHIFRENTLSCCDLPDLPVSVYGFGFTSKNYLSSPVAGWSIRDKSRINILVTHGDMVGTDGTNGPISKREIADSGFDYIALGHIHKPTGLQCENGVYYAYPGCIEGRSFDELGYRGAMFGEIEKGRVDMQLKRFSKSRYEWISVDLSGVREKMEALDRIRDAIKSYTDDTALRINLQGELKNAFVIRANEIGKGCEYPYFIELIDETYIEPDIGELEQSNTLKGVFVRKMKEKLEKATPDSDEYKSLLLAMKYGIAALDDRSVIDYGGGEKA